MSFIWVFSAIMWVAEVLVIEVVVVVAAKSSHSICFVHGFSYLLISDHA